MRRRRASCSSCMHQWCYQQNGDRGGCLLWVDGWRAGVFDRLNHDDDIRRAYLKPRERR